MISLTFEERELVRKALQQLIWDTTSNKQAILAQQIIDKLNGGAQ